VFYGFLQTSLKLYALNTWLTRSGCLHEGLVAIDSLRLHICTSKHARHRRRLFYIHIHYCYNNCKNMTETHMSISLLILYFINNKNHCRIIKLELLQYVSKISLNAAGIYHKIYFDLTVSLGK